MPTYKTFETSFDNNPDGAGYMFAKNGKVHIEKGLMTFTDFKKSLSKTIKSLGGKKSASKIPMVFHFRITTQGGVKPELTHPFAFSNNYDDMKKLSCDVDIAIAHNGIISATSSNADDHNDTMEFIKDIAYPLMNSHDKSLDVHYLLDKFLHGNKVVFLHGNGKVDMYGDWKENKGVFYSNETYKEKTFKTWSSYSSYYNDLYGYGYGRYYQDSKEDKEKTNKREIGKLAIMSMWQEDDLIANGDTWCDECGSEVYVDYDDELGCWVGTCMSCGKQYYIDDDVIDRVYGAEDYEFNN